MRSDRYKDQKTTLKVIILIILLLIIAIAGIVAYSYKTALDSLSLTFDYTPLGIESEETSDDSDILLVEVGGTYGALDVVKSSEGDVTPSSEFLAADETGDNELTYTVSKSLYGGLLTPSRNFTLRYSVVDTQPPIVLWNASGTKLQLGSEFKLDGIFSYADNQDPKPEVTIDGKVNMNQTGTYTVHITLTDASGNQTEDDLTVTVSDYVPSYTYTSEGTNFGDFARKNKGDGRTFGIDVSEWQGDVDYKAVKDAGCDFVMIRIGYSVDGAINEDDCFRKNLKNAKAAGLKVGLYMYSYDSTEDEARSAAREVISMLGGETLDLPVAFDWEDFGRFQSYEMSLNTLNRMYDAFAEELAAAGCDCMLYSSKSYLERVWQNTDTRPVWLAHYTDKTDYDGPYRIWQAGNTGRISGIYGDVDLDVMYE